jgi:hypothetical protein
MVLLHYGYEFDALGRAVLLAFGAKKAEMSAKCASKKAQSKSGKELLGNSGYRVKHRCRCLCVINVIRGTFERLNELQS